MWLHLGLKCNIAASVGGAWTDRWNCGHLFLCPRFAPIWAFAVSPPLGSWGRGGGKPLTPQKHGLSCFWWLTVVECLATGKRGWVKYQRSPVFWTQASVRLDSWRRIYFPYSVFTKRFDWVSDTHLKFNVRALDWLFGSGFNRFGQDDNEDSNQTNTEHI